MMNNEFTIPHSLEPAPTTAFTGLPSSSMVKVGQKAMWLLDQQIADQDTADHELQVCERFDQLGYAKAHRTT